MSEPGDALGADRIYDAFADHYRAYSDTKAAYLQAVDRKICSLFEGKVNSLLDFGAGDGLRGGNLAGLLGVDTLIQADISTEMVTKCRKLGVAKQVFDVKEDAWTSANLSVDLAVCLWNVLGHVPDTESRIAVLKTLHGMLNETGSICFDVNNRHYVGYGLWRSLGRRLIDAIAPDFSRGDIVFNWTIDGVEYPASGHFFTRHEVESLLQQAGFEVTEFAAIDYGNGKESNQASQGQLFFVARNRTAKP